MDIQITESDAAKKMQEQLQLLLLQVIETAMKKKYGKNWFQASKKMSEENAQKARAEKKKATPVINRSWTSLDDFDFAASVKTLFFLDDCFTAVIAYYGIGKEKDALHNTLQNLIYYRNNVSSAHRRAGDIRREQVGAEDERVFDHKKAMSDMLFVGKYFREEKNNSGESYYQIMNTIFQTFVHQKSQTVVQAEIRQNPLNAQVPKPAQPRRQPMQSGVKQPGQSPVQSRAQQSVQSSVQSPMPQAQTYGDKKIFKPVIIALGVTIAIVALTGAVLIGSRIGQHKAKSEQVVVADSVVTGSTQKNTSDSGMAAITGDAGTQNMQPQTAPASVSTMLYGTATLDGLQLTIEQEPSTGIRVKYKNTQGNSFSFGWASNSNVEAVTTEGTYYSYIENSSYKVLPGDEGTLYIYFSELPGQLKSLTIKSIYRLSERGLPEMGAVSGGEQVTITFE